MKNLILILTCLFTLNCYASDYSYDVTGEDENGRTFEGSINSNKGERNVSGELTDEQGKTHEFSGKWDGYKKITGETDDGTEVELETD